MNKKKLNKKRLKKALESERWEHETTKNKLQEMTQRFETLMSDKRVHEVVDSRVRRVEFHVEGVNPKAFGTYAVVSGKHEECLDAVTQRLSCEIGKELIREKLVQIIHKKPTDTDPAFLNYGETLAVKLYVVPWEQVSEIKHDRRLQSLM